MAIIIDTNCLANVFSKSSDKHNEFKPVLDWILKGKGFLIYGGSKYNEELKKTPKYLPILRLLKDVGKVHKGNDDNIDNIENSISKTNTSKLFNDIHILAICLDTKCNLVCSEDTTSIPFITDPKHFGKGNIRPNFYTSSRNKDILDDKYVNQCYKPLCKINKEIAKKIEQSL
ncbi:hypothetical protein [Chishuiella changwenlii]|uniref:hypothetical protein n=1 Tax=Chishuiella changwenlii TaxID=1434701 RepID=UPI002FD89AD6